MSEPQTRERGREPGRSGRAGRPRSVPSEVILSEARRQVDAVGVNEFSVRELAKAVGLVPGTILARFGNRDELLAELYLQRIVHVERLLDDPGGEATKDVASFLRVLSPPLSQLRYEFVMHIERDGIARPHLTPETWERLRTSFARLSVRLHACFRQAAEAEGVKVVGGSQARRLVWTVASTIDSGRTALAFSHADASYRRFAGRVLLDALAADG